MAVCPAQSGREVGRGVNATAAYTLARTPASVSALTRVVSSGASTTDTQASRAGTKVACTHRTGHLVAVRCARNGADPGQIVSEFRQCGRYRPLLDEERRHAESR